MKSHVTTGIPSVDALPEPVRQRLVEVLESYLTDLEEGKAPDAEELIARHPDLAEPLRAYLGGLDFLHEAAVGLRSGGQAVADPPDLAAKELGEYTIIREIGRGGMGVVYEARQRSLDRRVALKVLPFAAVLDRKQIARFHNEAQAAAHLQHPNIVPVFSVGCERGVHYYAMQYIDGQPLDVAIRQLRRLADPLPGGDRLPRTLPHTDSSGKGARHLLCEAPEGPFRQKVPGTFSTGDDSTVANRKADTAGLESSTWRSFADAASLRRGEFFRTVARLGIEAADALEHAHQCGIVHRDVKPSNLLLDEQGKVWITDFGLARFQTDSSLTMTGDVMGTVRYMSPEQAAGKAALVDGRTDVYSLGITLYELATLRDAFEGTDRQAFMRWIVDDEPRAPRQLNPAIPVDLETILLKAIAKSPEDRYATAQELADDLRHFLAGEPVRARRASLADRASKWARRHRTVVVAGVALAAVVLVGSVVSTLLIVNEHGKTRAALNEAENNYQQSQENLRRAEKHFRQLRNVVDRFGGHHAERLKDLPGAEPLRREMLLDALRYYRGFIEHAADDPTLQADLAWTYSKAAGVTDQIGDKQAALASYDKAIGAFESVVAGQPDALDARANLALCLNNRGLLLDALGQQADAEKAYHKALELQKALVAEKPETARFQGELAATHGNLGLLATSLDRLKEANEAYQEAIRLQEKLVERFPDEPRWLRELAMSYNNLSFLLVKTDRVKAEAASRQAQAIQERLVKARPGNLDYQNDLALSYCNLGALENRNGRPKEAEASYRKAIAIQEQLVRRAPSVTRFRRQLAVTCNNFGSMYLKTDQLESALEAFQRARVLMAELVDDDPSELGYRGSLGGMLHNLGSVFEKLDRTDDAAKAYEQAITHQRYALDRAPQVVRFREFLAQHYAGARRVYRALGRRDDDLAAASAEAALWPGNPKRLLEIAADLASAVAVLDQQAKSETPFSQDDRAARQKYVDLAVKILGMAVDAGLDPTGQIGTDPRFTPLHGDSSFVDLSKRLTSPQE
ncbi:MAG: protein kinase [Pirellulales bacterium]|nr:protein kinase [Pirellulales bacterium]